MKKRTATLVLFLYAVTSQIAYAEGGWGPGQPKPGLDTWLSATIKFFGDVWNYVM